MDTQPLSPKWCHNDEPHPEHTARNQFGGTDYCSGRPAPKPTVPNLVTPCHGAPLLIEMGYDGHGYMSHRVVEAIVCSAPTCTNSWDSTGVLIQEAR